MKYKVIQKFKGLDMSVRVGDILIVKDYTDEYGTYPALWKNDKVICDIGSRAEERCCKIIG
jgi:hypothetical protein